MSESLGERLRKQREQRNIALSAIAEDTKIKVSLFHDLEHDDVSRWPTGIFRRAFVRAYARAVGLDSETVLREFLAVHPDPSCLPDVDAATNRTAANPAAVPPPDFELDMQAAASICTRMAQVQDIAELEPLLAEMIPLVTARGVVVWRWRPDAARLVAAFSAGYDRAVIGRLPGVHRDADNATAAAFRSAQMTIVLGGESGNGAIAAPAVSPYGVVAVLALELAAGREREKTVQVVSTIWAAQLAGMMSMVASTDQRSRSA